MTHWTWQIDHKRESFSHVAEKYWEGEKNYIFSTDRQKKISREKKFTLSEHFKLRLFLKNPFNPDWATQAQDRRELVIQTKWRSNWKISKLRNVEWIFNFVTAIFFNWFKAQSRRFYRSDLFWHKIHICDQHLTSLVWVKFLFVQSSCFPPRKIVGICQSFAFWIYDDDQFLLWIRKFIWLFAFCSSILQPISFLSKVPKSCKKLDLKFCDGQSDKNFPRVLACNETEYQ